MPRSHAPYPAEFKAEAVRLYRTSAKSLREVSADLGMSTNSLREWVRRAEVNEGQHEGLSDDEREELKRLKRENRILKEEREILRKAGGLLRQGDRPEPLAAFEFVEREKAKHSVTRMCQMLGVSPSGYYAWRKRGPSHRSQEDARLLEIIKAIHAKSRRTYGTPRIHAELRRKHQIHCSRRRVARLMREAGLEGVYRRRKRGTTIRDPARPVYPDRVERQFSPDIPDRVWVADITQHQTDEGWLYLAVVIDAYSRKVIGWSFADHLRAELVIKALEMALWNRRPGAGVIHHSDHGSQYTSLTFGQCLEKAGILGSMGTVGDALDNALAESFFATLQLELLDRQHWSTRQQLATAIFDYIEVFFNRQRLHSTLGYLSPSEFEEVYALKQAA
ncbi:MAG TPA: IS3 family transposase [Chloroflexota bacterium]|nr:IS3 family transposase [Chloroflexota bacterium]